MVKPSKSLELQYKSFTVLVDLVRTVMWTLNNLQVETSARYPMICVDHVDHPTIPMRLLQNLDLESYTDDPKFSDPKL